MWLQHPGRIEPTDPRNLLDMGLRVGIQSEELQEKNSVCDEVKAGIVVRLHVLRGSVQYNDDYLGKVRL